MRTGKTTKLREQKFVETYAVTFHLTNSAIAAGYPKRSAAVRGAELLRKESVQKALKKRLKLVLKKQNLSPEFVLTGLREVFERCMQLKEVTDKEGVGLGVFKFEPQAALKALELIGRNYDMFSPDVVVNLNVDLDKQLMKARNRISEIRREKKSLKDITEETVDLSAEPSKKHGLEAATIAERDQRLA